jgi:TP901 family phage tail tape measure protein
MSAGAIRAGRAFVEIFAADSAFQQSMTRIRTSIATVGQQLRRAGTGTFLGGAAISAPIALAVRQFASFDDAIRAAAAAAGKGEGDLAAMGAAAEKLALQFGMGATEVATLGVEVARAFGDKLTTDQLNKVTASVLAMSKATGTEGVRSASIMASTLAQFGMGAEEAARVADVLTFTANATLNSVDSLGEALKYAGTNAALAGMDIEQTAAILGTLGNLGVQGSDAGTVLKRLLIITGAEAEKLKGIFGVSFLDMDGNVRPLVETLDEVSRATAGMASGERIAKMNEAFGLLGISAAIGIGQAGDATRKLENDIRNATGTALSQAQFMEAGVGGSMRQMRTNIETLGNAFSAVLAPVLNSITGDLVGVAQSIAAVAKENPGLAMGLAGTAAGMIAIGGAGIIAGNALQTLTVAIGLAQKAIALMVANPAVLAGVATFAAAFGAVTLAVRQLSPAFREASDEWLKMVGIINGNQPNMPGKGLAGERPTVSDADLKRNLVFEESKITVDGIQREAVATGGASDSLRQMRDVAAAEMQRIKDARNNVPSPTLGRDQRVLMELPGGAAELDRRMLELAGIISNLDRQIAARTAPPEEQPAPAAPPPVRGPTAEQTDAANRVREQMRTPQEKLTAERNRLLELLNAQALDEPTFLKAVAAAEAEALAEITAANEKARQEYERIADRVKTIGDEVATPAEKLAARIEELRSLPLDAETFARAVEAAKADAVSGMTQQQQAEPTSIASAGTFGDAAMLAIGPNLIDPAQQTADNTRRMVDQLAALELAKPAPAAAAAQGPAAGQGNAARHAEESSFIVTRRQPASIASMVASVPTITGLDEWIPAVGGEPSASALREPGQANAVPAAPAPAPLQLAAQAVAPRADQVRQAVDLGAEIAAQTATLSTAFSTAGSRIVEAVNRTTDAVRATVDVLQQIADNTTDLGGAFL